VSGLTKFGLCAWSMTLFREVLRLLLAASGDLPWRGWHVGLEWWPSYVTAWSVVSAVCAAFWIWLLWGQREG